MHPVKLLTAGSTLLATPLTVCSWCTGRRHRSLVFSSQRGRAEALPGPGTSHAAELAMSRPDVSPETLSPSAEAIGATQPVEALEQPLSGVAEPGSPEQVIVEAVVLVFCKKWAEGEVSHTAG